MGRKGKVGGERKGVRARRGLATTVNQVEEGWRDGKDDGDGGTAVVMGMKGRSVGGDDRWW